MGVGDSGHGVYLEVLVGADVGHILDWAPVGEGWLRIVEPLVAQLLDVVVVNVGNSLGNLASWESSAQEEHVFANIIGNCSWRLGIQQLVVEVISSSDDLDIVEIVRVDSWEADSAVVHLSGEYLISEEVVSKETTVRICEIV